MRQVLFIHGAIDEHIIKIYDNKPANKWMKHLVHDVHDYHKRARGAG